MRLRFNQIFERAKHSPAKEVKAEAEKEISQVRGEIEQGYPEPEMGEEVAASQWQPGDIAWVSKLRVSARVNEVDQQAGEATLVVGSIHLKEKLSGLRRIKPAEKSEPKETGSRAGAATDKRACADLAEYA